MKKLTFVCILLCLMLLFASCSSNGQLTAAEPEPDDIEAAQAAPAAEAPAAAPAEEPAPLDPALPTNGVQILGLDGGFVNGAQVGIWPDFTAEQKLSGNTAVDTYTGSCTPPDKAPMEIAIRFEYDNGGEPGWVCENISTTVTVNGSTAQASVHEDWCIALPVGAAVIDLDVADNSTEVILFSVGEEADAWMEIFSFDGSNCRLVGMVEISGHLDMSGVSSVTDSTYAGSFSAAAESFLSDVYVDMQGTFVWSGNMCQVTKPMFALDAYNISSGKLSKVAVDRSAFMEVPLDAVKGSVWFVPSSTDAVDYEWWLYGNDSYTPHELTGADSITVLALSRDDNIDWGGDSWLFVRLNGETGFIITNAWFLG